VRAAARRDLRGGGHARPGGPRAHLAGRRLGIDLVGLLIDRYADNVRVHLVHLGGGVSGHIKLIGGRFFDWVAAGKRVYTDTSWAVGFAPRWLAAEIERRGLGHDRLLFASDEPWGDHPGELARLAAAVGDGELARHVFVDNFDTLAAALAAPDEARRAAGGARRAAQLGRGRARPCHALPPAPRGAPDRCHAGCRTHIFRRETLMTPGRAYPFRGIPAPAPTTSP